MWMVWILGYLVIGGISLVYLRTVRLSNGNRFIHELETEMNDAEIRALLVLTAIPPLVWPLWFPVLGSASLIEAGLKGLPAAWARLRLRRSLRRSAAKSARGRNVYTQTAGDSF